MKRLPATLDDLRGLRAARWLRESTRGQWDRFGPDAQRDQQDRAVERHELVDTGIEWVVAHSGRTIGSSQQFADMLARAGTDYDVLLVGYTSRFSRHLKATLVAVEDHLHPAHAVVLFCDERVLSSDDDAWETWTREAHEAESYSRRLGKRVREGLASKRRRFADPAGQLPYGFVRAGDQHLVTPDPETMPSAVRAYQLASEGRLDADIARGLGLSLWTVRGILRSRLYRGELGDGTPTMFPAPVRPDLWDRATDRRERRTHSGHQSHRHRTYPLTDRGPLVCAECGGYYKGAYRTDRGLAIYRGTCPHRREARADVLEGQVAQLLRRAKPDAASAVRIRAALAEPASEPDRLALARVSRDRTAALARYARDRDSRALDATMAALDAQEAAARVVEADAEDPDTALRYLGSLGTLWRETTAEGRRALALALFSRLAVLDKRIVEVECTPEAEAKGLVLALPVTMVGDTGVSAPAVTWPVRIVNRAAWMRHARARRAG